MSLDMYNEKVSDAAQLIRDLTGGKEWFHEFDRNTQHTLELFIAAMDKVKADILASLPAPVAPLPADTDKLRDASALMRAAIDCGHVIMADRIVLECNPDKPGNALSQLRERLNAAASTAGQAPVREVPGWQLVPKMPTTEMMDAPEVAVGGCYSCSAQQVSWSECTEIYKSMLAAAPLPAAPVLTEGE